MPGIKLNHVGVFATIFVGISIGASAHATVWQDPHAAKLGNPAGNIAELPGEYQNGSDAESEFAKVKAPPLKALKIAERAKSRTAEKNREKTTEKNKDKSLPAKIVAKGNIPRSNSSRRGPIPKPVATVASRDLSARERGFMRLAQEEDRKDTGISGVEEVQDGAAEDEAWDSYSDSRVADDVTNGVRIEDIVEPPSDYRYAAFGRPDPFVPPLVAEQVNAVEIPIVSPLQRHSLADMGVVGVWGTSDGVKKALVNAREGSSFIGVVTKIGDPIGNSGGKIIGINRDGITVREFALAPDGTRKFSDHFMALGQLVAPQLSPDGRVILRPGATKPEVINSTQRDGQTVKDDQGVFYKEGWSTGTVNGVEGDKSSDPAAIPTMPSPSPGAGLPVGPAAAGASNGAAKSAALTGSPGSSKGAGQAPQNVPNASGADPSAGSQNGQIGSGNLPAPVPSYGY